MSKTPVIHMFHTCNIHVGVYPTHTLQVHILTHVILSKSVLKLFVITDELDRFSVPWIEYPPGGSIKTGSYVFLPVARFLGNTIVLSNSTIVWYKCFFLMLPWFFWWHDVTIVQYDITIVVPWQLSTESIQDYLLLLPPIGYSIWGTENCNDPIRPQVVRELVLGFILCYLIKYGLLSLATILQYATMWCGNLRWFLHSRLLLGLLSPSSYTHTTLPHAS